MTLLRRWISVLGIITLMLATAAWADPPARVGRVSYLSGSVSFKASSLGEWVTATLNYPVTTGNALSTAEDSRAEIGVGSTALRIGAGTAIDILALDDTTLKIRVSQGTLNVRLRRLYQGDGYEVFTPGTAVSLMQPGQYRIDVGADASTTRVSALQGDAEVTAAGSVFSVREGEALLVSGANSVTYDAAGAAPDEFDRWAMSRDPHEEGSESLRYVSPEMTGYADLDEHGSWREVSGYGSLWFPSAVSYGWAPYRFGHWAWVDPWGWTWIDHAPWGFAPFHFGRWVFINGAWAWSPGIIGARPVFAPALVTFIGGKHFSLFISSGTVPVIGWFPLAPGEVFIPAFRCSPVFIRKLNAAHVNVTTLNVTNVHVETLNFVNRTVPGAVTVVTKQTFVDSVPVVNSVVKVPINVIVQAPVSGTTAPVAPSSTHIVVQPGGTAINTTVPHPIVAQRSVVTVVDPPASSSAIGMHHPFAAPSQVPAVNSRTPVPIRRHGPNQPPAAPAQAPVMGSPTPMSMPQPTGQAPAVNSHTPMLLRRDGGGAGGNSPRQESRAVLPQPTPENRAHAHPGHQDMALQPSQNVRIVRPMRWGEEHPVTLPPGQPAVGAAIQCGHTMGCGHAAGRGFALGHSIRAGLGRR